MGNSSTGQGAQVGAPREELATHTVTIAEGVQMPLVGLGTWRLGDRAAYDALLWALQAGYRHVDTATMYRNEADLGAALGDSGLAREEVFVTTKLPADAAGDERQVLERSLQALRTDHVDLWLVHWPPNGAGVDVWRAFIDLAAEGLARAIGVSNYSPAQVDELIEATGVAPAVNQVKWSPFVFDQDLLRHSRDRGVVLEGYSPFAAAQLDHPVLVELAERHGKTPAQVVVRWHVEHGVVVIPKSAHRERITANIDVFDFSLGPDEVAVLDGLAEAR